MGGAAFQSVLGAEAFPRMPYAVYSALKARMILPLQKLYEHVAVPIEMPEKKDFGDLDFVVAVPRASFGEGDAPNVPHETVFEYIGARCIKPEPGNRTSNFAIPIARQEWATLGHGDQEETARQMVEHGEIFYQVDVNVCMDKGEFDRVVFFHSYGDLGMIMGLIARNAGLALGEKGFKMPNQPYKPVELSQSFDDILRFFGWSMDTWRAGFRTKREIFEWAGSTHLFDPRRFRSAGEGFTKVKQDRKMYGEFVEWAVELQKKTGMKRKQAKSDEEIREFRDDVLRYFNKKEEYDAQTHERENRAKLKTVFNGTSIRDMGNLGENWRAVKLIMDEMRQRYGGDNGVLEMYDTKGEGTIREIVLEIKDKLSLTSAIHGRDTMPDSARQETEATESEDHLL